jgi:hypothetical protein
MKKRTILLLLVSAILLPQVTNAQVGVLRRAINRQIDNKIDSAITKSAQDKAKEQGEQDQPQARENRGTKETGRGLFGGKIDIKYEDEYKFTGRLVMQMETYDKKDVVKSDYYTYFNANTLNAGIEVSVVDPDKGQAALLTQFIFDNDNRCMMVLTLGQGSKTGIISTIPDDSTLTAQAKTQNVRDEKQAIITKTGNTRMIAGYRCDEYKVVEADQDGYSNVWMTKDVRIKADKKNWGKTGMPTYYNYPDFEGSMMLAFESYDKKNNLQVKMETKEINENYNHSISTVGYTFMKMNFGQAGKK